MLRLQKDLGTSEVIEAEASPGPKVGWFCTGSEESYIRAMMRVPSTAAASDNIWSATCLLRRPGRVLPTTTAIFTM